MSHEMRPEIFAILSIQPFPPCIESQVKLNQRRSFQNRKRKSLLLLSDYAAVIVYLNYVSKQADVKSSLESRLFTLSVLVACVAEINSPMT